MKHPGGTSCGARWTPLARWVGWPSSTLSHLAYIITRESSGRERALNASSSCAGLLQLHPGWYRGWWHLSGVRQPFDPFDAETNLHAGYHMWRAQGWAPWSL
jgi:hypothetical protein